MPRSKFPKPIPHRHPLLPMMVLPSATLKADVTLFPDENSIASALKLFGTSFVSNRLFEPPPMPSDTAAHPDMPESAIASGCVDYVLAPEAIANKIRQIAFGVSERTDGNVDAVSAT